ncbi:hypothetical protein [Bradyrhizobium sp. JR3.5]
MWIGLVRRLALDSTLKHGAPGQRNIRPVDDADIRVLPDSDLDRLEVVAEPWSVRDDRTSATAMISIGAE